MSCENISSDRIDLGDDEVIPAAPSARSHHNPMPNIMPFPDGVSGLSSSAR